jgi:hypothetical protein
MGADGVGSSVIIALAAVLWLAYLVPTWLQRLAQLRHPARQRWRRCAATVS